MKRTVLLLAAMLVANVLPAAQQANSVPKTFEAKFVGMESSYHITLQKRALLCTRSAVIKETKLEVTPSKKQWAEFRHNLDKVGAWQWRTNYRNDAVTDGMFWSLTIVYPDRTVRASGLNSYPDEKGKPGTEAGYTKAFDTYTRALDKLTGGKFMKK